MQMTLVVADRVLFARTMTIFLAPCGRARAVKAPDGSNQVARAAAVAMSAAAAFPAGQAAGTPGNPTSSESRWSCAAIQNVEAVEAKEAGEIQGMTAKIIPTNPAAGSIALRPA